MRHAFPTRIKRLSEARYRCSNAGDFVFLQRIKVCFPSFACIMRITTMGSCACIHLCGFLTSLQEWFPVPNCRGRAFFCNQGSNDLMPHMVLSRKRRRSEVSMRELFYKYTFAATSTAGFITMLGNTRLQRVYVAAKSTVSELCIHHSLHDPEAFDATNALRVQLAACISMRFCMHCWGAKQAK